MNTDYDQTVQGIVMYPKLKDYILPNNMNYQQYIFNDKTFQNIMAMYHNNDEFRLVQVLADDDNQSCVDNVFQNIMSLIYKTLAESSSSIVGKGKFHIMIIKEMQKSKNSEYDIIFKTHFPTMYEDTLMNNKFR